MTKKNIVSSNATTFAQTSELSGKSFKESFGILAKAFMRRLNLDRARLAKSFDAKAFWADNDIAEEIITSAYRRPKMDSSGKQIERKGKLVFETVRMNLRIVQSAAGIIRRGVRTEPALKALVSKSESLEAAVKLADSFGSILRLVPRMNKAGLVANNSAGNNAKNAAIAAFEQPGETPNTLAKLALIGSLYGKPVTTAQVKLVTDKLKAFEESEEPRVPLTFDSIFGIVKSMKAHKAQKARKLATRKTTASEPVIQTGETGEQAGQPLLTGTDN